MLTIATWNIEFTPPSSICGRAIRRVLSARYADIVVLTEAFADTISGGHVACSGGKYGYQADRKRHNVVLWSRMAFRNIDCFGSPDLPPDRFVAGTTETPIGAVRVLGICLPREDGNVNAGCGDRVPGEDYVNYLAVLDELLHRDFHSERLIIAGNWNRCRPAARLPLHVREAQRRTFRHVCVATAGALPLLSSVAIDDVAHTRDLATVNVACWPGYDADSTGLRHRSGVEVQLRAGDAVLQQRNGEQNALGS
jgi:hypothetical protein